MLPHCWECWYGYLNDQCRPKPAPPLTTDDLQFAHRQLFSHYYTTTEICPVTVARQSPTFCTFIFFKQ